MHLSVVDGSSYHVTMHMHQPMTPTIIAMRSCAHVSATQPSGTMAFDVQSKSITTNKCRSIVAVAVINNDDHNNYYNDGTITVAAHSGTIVVTCN